MSKTLSNSLNFEPVELAFGTSGLRGRVADLSQLEVAINTLGFLRFLESAGQIRTGDTVWLAGDLRPSTREPVEIDGHPRGEMLQAVAWAVTRAGYQPDYLGLIPTPALMAYAMGQHQASIMVTGSHIPFDRNGIKFNKPDGEVLKADEPAILKHVHQVRRETFQQAAAASPFAPDGRLKPAHHSQLPPENPAGRRAYLDQYLKAFPTGILKGRRILVYQHSAVGRDLLIELLEQLGANASPVGRSDQFIPVDTEAVQPSMLHDIQRFVDANGGRTVDAVVSTDGDSDRPLLLGVEDGQVRFCGGDLLGIVTADFFGARHVAVPISANDAVDRFFGPQGVQVVKTRIGSPHVIASMREVGWEANGGFLTARPCSVPGGGSLPPLPTRDAFLPLLAALYASLGRGMSVVDCFDKLPQRFGKADVVRDFPREISLGILTQFEPQDPRVEEAWFEPERVRVRFKGTPHPQLRMDRDHEPNREGRDGFHAVRRTRNRGRNGGPGGTGPYPKRFMESEQSETVPPETAQDLREKQTALQAAFGSVLSESKVNWVNWCDGCRFSNDAGEILHLRPSGNAPEQRVYAVADSPDRAEEMVQAVVQPGGILEQLRGALAKTLARDSGALDDPPGLGVRRPRAALPASERSEDTPVSLPPILRLEGVVQHYDWGGTSFIPELLDRPNPDHKPVAELWLGAHPSASSRVNPAGTPCELRAFIRRHGPTVLGPQVAETYGNELPYLLKILDAQHMLSIQAHPNRAQAQAGFAREHAAGIPLTAPTRNYKDPHPKPEVHVALTPFWMLHGFRPLEDVLGETQRHPELTPAWPGLAEALPRVSHEPVARQELLRNLYERVMRLPQSEVDAILRPLLDRLQQQPVTDPSDPAFWLQRAAATFAPPEAACDRGLFSIFLLNLVHLEPGQSTFQDAGVLHAYLEGATVELMAGSDNVLRGGLTPKHVDVEELLRIVRFEELRPMIGTGTRVDDRETVFRTPAREFELSRLTLSPGEQWAGRSQRGPECLLVIEGAVDVSATTGTERLTRGQSAWVSWGVDYSIQATGITGTIVFRARLPEVTGK